ncbi:hypothetical protein PCANC_10692 [Puccinia coronata f. sp. avenae]|uniref:Inhibitor I9 domain-containing protein n=1 Tax=Puccinia coronata f. sp. avenae TaxID=200324 RepID=A0A2N5VGE5_9BASI|nr:hypothetical protein PCANC_15844 [Puccinia coronata f. sp. avenae]PLW48976.1 hypothetical protein PCANC_10692 [Puccinia coronata f. sp. avenae]
MTNSMTSASFLLVLLISALGLILPGLTSAAVVPGAHAVSHQTSSLDRRGSHPSSASSTKSERAAQEEPLSVYIIMLVESTTAQQYANYKKYLTQQGIKIKYEYNDIKGFAVWLKASQVKAFQKDKKVDTIEKDSSVSTNS